MGAGRKLFFAAAAAAVAGVVMLSGPYQAEAAETQEPPDQDWPFEGPFGRFDRAAVQRGLQVYLEVCSFCHSLRQVAYRDLAAVGFNQDEIKAIAAQYEVTDGPDENGDMYQRPALPSDKFVSPFPNENAAKAANNGALPPDLSLLVKAKPAGADYIYAILAGFEDPPDDVTLGEGLYYNPYFSGGQIAMAPPLFEDAVSYADGTPASVENMARDVANFLHWTAEPKMEDRKFLGLKVILFLIVFSAIMYAAKRKMWARLH